jgi:hypothetical protein
MAGIEADPGHGTAANHMNNFGDKVTFIWSVADLIRDSFKRSKYPDVILPLGEAREPGPRWRSPPTQPPARRLSTAIRHQCQC